MSSILNRLKIEQNLILTFDASPEKFCRDFKNHVSSENHYPMLDILDSSPFRYYGKINNTSIFIRGKLSLTPSKRFLIAKGTIIEFDNKTKLKLRIRSFYHIQIVLFILGIFFFLYLLYLAFTRENGLGLLVMILPFFLFWIIYPIYKARKDLKIFKNQLTADLKSYVEG